MAQKSKIFQISQRASHLFTWGDIFAFTLIAAILYLGIRLAFDAPAVIAGPEISISPARLPWYTALSVSRMLAAYVLSILFSLFYGRVAAYHKRAEQLLMPLLDVLQSVPILSFLPVVLLSLSAILPEKIAVELASIILIFTSQAWNLTFSWYQSLTTIPNELKEASSIFGLNSWMRFKKLELPFGMISLVWNSMMSWAGGWFFLMAAEFFTVGTRDFRLPGLGAFLHEAAQQSDFAAIAWGIGALVLTVVILDQLIWRPLLAWSDRFKVEMVENDNPPQSWFYNLVEKANVVKWFSQQVILPVTEFVDQKSISHYPAKGSEINDRKRKQIVPIILTIALILLLIYILVHAAEMLFSIPLVYWGEIAMSVLATLIRVAIALIIAMAWTIPLGVAIGTNKRLATILQPIVQVIASIPATALFPIIILLVLNLPGGLNLAAVILMLMGTQWYLLFNIIAGASAIPQDLKYTSQLMQLNRRQRWRTLILPGIFPYLVTGAITASGGAWNASIVAEYQVFSGKIHSVYGIGSLIAQSTVDGNYPLLLAATIAMVLAVVLINRLIWRRLYILAEEKYRMEV
jgi:NitT/TauT family transport system permease protein